MDGGYHPREFFITNQPHHRVKPLPLRDRLRRPQRADAGTCRARCLRRRSWRSRPRSRPDGSGRWLARLAMDMLAGALHMRAMLTHEPLEPDLPERLADAVLFGLHGPAAR
jgi:hypothetical protein